MKEGTEFMFNLIKDLFSLFHSVFDWHGFAKTRLWPRIAWVSLGLAFCLSASAQQMTVAIATHSGYFTAVNGGGLGGANGAGNVALHTNAKTPGPWETFTVHWLDAARSKFALQTVNGTYVTAVNGGGIGGPNNARSPVHTDATTIGPEEVFTFRFTTANGVTTATIRTPNGDYLTAVNGGGIGGPNNIPIHTDATSIGPWETFMLIGCKL
jgi:hypothetical protein